MQRLGREVKALHQQKDYGFAVCGDNLRHLLLFIDGPDGTPYEGCVLAFELTFGERYPIAPPHMKLLSTDAGRVRLNPNFYANGKVCVSALNTWAPTADTGWTPALTVTGIAAAVQSLMTRDPFHNEPGFESCAIQQQQQQRRSHQSAKGCNQKDESVASPAMVSVFYNSQGDVDPARNCCRYGVKIRHEAVRLGCLLPLAACLVAERGADAADVIFARLTSTRRITSATAVARCLPSTTASSAGAPSEAAAADIGGASVPPEAAVGNNSNDDDQAQAVAGQYAAFVRVKVLPRARKTADSLDALHALLVDERGGGEDNFSPRSSNDSNKVPSAAAAAANGPIRAPFEGPENEAAVSSSGFHFAQLAHDIRLLAEALGGLDQDHDNPTLGSPTTKDERGDDDVSPSLRREFTTAFGDDTRSAGASGRSKATTASGDGLAASIRRRLGSKYAMFWIAPLAAAALAVTAMAISRATATPQLRVGGKATSSIRSS